MAAGLLLELHGELLRDVSAATSMHFAGLASAARHLRKHGVIDNSLQKKLAQLDTATSYVRHITAPRACELRELVQQCCQRGASTSGGQPAQSLGDTLQKLHQDIEAFKSDLVDDGPPPPKPVADYLAELTAGIEDLFKKCRGLNHSSLPPISGMTEVEAHAFFEKHSENMIKNMHDNGFPVEQLPAARAVAAEKCKAGMEGWKRFVDLCTADRAAGASSSSSCVAPDLQQE